MSDVDCRKCASFPGLGEKCKARPMIAMEGNVMWQGNCTAFAEAESVRPGTVVHITDERGTTFGYPLADSYLVVKDMRSVDVVDPHVQARHRVEVVGYIDLSPHQAAELYAMACCHGELRKRDGAYFCARCKTQVTP